MIERPDVRAADAGRHSGPPPSRPIDLVHLARFTLGNRALEREVLELFAGQLPSYLADLEAAPTEKAWTIAAHTIKGSARAVGAGRLATAAEAAEALARNPDAEVRRRSVAQVRAAFAEATDYIATLFQPA